MAEETKRGPGRPRRIVPVEGVPDVNHSDFVEDLQAEDVVEAGAIPIEIVVFKERIIIGNKYENSVNVKRTPQFRLSYSNGLLRVRRGSDECLVPNANIAFMVPSPRS